MPLDDLGALRAFRAVVRAGSFSAAAAATRAPKSTLSKRVADLEAELGVRLIERTTRAFRVTPEGEALAARADRLLAEAEDIRRSLGEGAKAARGPLRVAVPVLMGNLVMGGLAARFRAAHPEITLEVHFLDRPPDLLEEGFDGALRFGPLEDGSLVARRMIDTHAVAVAAPSLPGAGDVREPRDLPRLPLMGLASPWPGAWTLVDAQGREAAVPAEPAIRLGSLLALRDAAMAGGGAALLPALLAGPEVAAGHLLRLLPGWTTRPKPLFFVYPSPQSMTARLRLFIDALTRELREVVACGA